jgi:hypothetical protein
MRFYSNPVREGGWSVSVTENAMKAAGRYTDVFETLVTLLSYDSTNTRSERG